MSTERHYLVYDGRFLHDPDAATVLEMLGEFRTLKAAMREARQWWGQQGAVLVSYRDAGGELIDEQVHGEVP